VLRSTAGRLESPIGDVLAIASEHDEVAGTERGPNTIFVFELDGLRVAHFGDFGQRELREEQAAAIVSRLPTRWVVPMHYRTPRVDFLAESEEEFVAAMPQTARLGTPEFDTAELPADGGPIAVVPAAP
jgi:L-ascorbate metabolism protein UlaG (beta-lactamase superfamily)